MNRRSLADSLVMALWVLHRAGAALVRVDGADGPRFRWEGATPPKPPMPPRGVLRTLERRGLVVATPRPDGAAVLTLTAEGGTVLADLPVWSQSELSSYYPGSTRH